MKRLLYLALLIPCVAQAQKGCTVCPSQRSLESGGAIRQAEGGAMGQTMPAFRGEGSQRAEYESGQ